MQDGIHRVRGEEQIEAVRALVWEFFGCLESRYPEMADELAAYQVEQNVAGDLENFAAVFLPPKGECFVAVHNGEPAGIVMLKPSGVNDCELNRMYVRDAARGNRLGRALGEAAVAEARARGYDAVRLRAIYRHKEALPLYESLGFQRYSDPALPRAGDGRFIYMVLTL